MRYDIRRIIAEELNRIVEGEVIRPVFGGKKSEPKKTPFQEALSQIEVTIINILNEDDHKNDTHPADHENRMTPDELTYLDKMLKKINETQRKLESPARRPRSRRPDERPFGAEPTERERDELARFNKWAEDEDGF